MTGGGPEAVEREQVFIDQRQRRCGMADRADAADCVAGLLADELGVGAGELADPFGHFLFVHAVHPARNHEHRRVIFLAAKQN